MLNGAVIIVRLHQVHQLNAELLLTVQPSQLNWAMGAPVMAAGVQSHHRHCIISPKADKEQMKELEKTGHVCGVLR